MAFSALASILLQYQSKRRCAKTGRSVSPASKRLQYQSKRRCAKTILSRAERSAPLQYQSKRRCAKTRGSLFASYYCCNTSQNDAAPKLPYPFLPSLLVAIPVKTTLRQNAAVDEIDAPALQYQSKRRCAKTLATLRSAQSKLQYQSKRRCAKTRPQACKLDPKLQYQSKRRCAKTISA